ncbi:MAG: hypothetical protein JWM91_1045 [Rhodospirillales bacterium]|nr:hypothetical protein [Rhodospirillales bacterium]
MNAPILTYTRIIEEICDLNWKGITRDDLTLAAWAYYFFSIQFRENLQIARQLYPDDVKLRQLEEEECDTHNLSPWPGIAYPGERMNHDEFMRRLVELSPIDPQLRCRIEELGRAYLDAVRGIEPLTRAVSISSYENGGLQSVFRAFLTSQDWDSPLLQAFGHFLTQHIKFDGGEDDGGGHGALARHLVPDDRILPLWVEFKHLLVGSAPRLAHPW